jgi:hypothetical protein
MPSDIAVADSTKACHRAGQQAATALEAAYSTDQIVHNGVLQRGYTLWPDLTVIIISGAATMVLLRTHSDHVP